MIFNNHFNLAGTHAFLSASNYHWVNYSDDKFAEVYYNSMAAKRGTELHALANMAIKLGQKFPRNNKSLNQFVNDAIGFRMSPEQILFYSLNAYGTSDAVSFDKGLLRIHDYKSGVIKGSFRQLEVYAALFCLEYNEKPGAIQMELRIYQNDEVLVLEPEVDVIARIMDRIITFDKKIEQMKLEA